LGAALATAGGIGLGLESDAGWPVVDLVVGWGAASLLVSHGSRRTAVLLGLTLGEAAVRLLFDPTVHPVRPLFFAAFGALNAPCLAASLRLVRPSWTRLRDQPLHRWPFYPLALVVPIPLALLEAWVRIELGGDEGLLAGARATWFAYALGYALVTPLVFALAVPTALPPPASGLRVLESWWVAGAALLGAAGVWAGHATEPLVGLALVWAAARTSPLETRALLFATVLTMAAAASPQASASLQGTVLVLALSVHGVTLVVSDQRAAIHRLREERRLDRAFVASAPEVVFRVRVHPPVPLDQERSSILEELEACATLERHNLEYSALVGDGGRAAVGRPWREDPIWHDVFLENFDDALTADFVLNGLDVSVRRGDGSVADLVVSFRGVVERGRLTGIWGMATDVSHLTRARRGLEEQRTQLRKITAEWVASEDRERHVLAHGLRTGVVADLDAALDAISAADEPTGPSGVDEHRQTVRRARAHAERARARVDGLVERLEPIEYERSGVRRSLERLVRESPAGVPRRVDVQLRIGDWIERLPEPMAVLTHRIARELIDAAEGRPHVRSARLSIDRPGGSLRIRCEERGESWRGQAADLPVTGPALRERVRALGGLVRVSEGEDGASTRLTIEIPVDATMRRDRTEGPSGADAPRWT
ncbi:MAG: hypothetical protein AAFP86_05930, partial [Planctomycetota bacterium]